MKKHLMIALAAVTMAAGTTLAQKLAVNEPAPDFTLTDIAGKTHTLADYRGKTVVLEWVNQECPFVVKHYASGNLPATQRAATADGVVWLTINSGRPGAQGDFEPARVEKWAKEHSAAYTAYFRDQDGKVGRLYGAKTTPHMFIVGTDGALLYKGAIDSIRSSRQSDIPNAKNYVAAALGEIKGGKPVADADTVAYGCTIHYKEGS